MTDAEFQHIFWLIFETLDARARATTCFYWKKHHENVPFFHTSPQILAAFEGQYNAPIIWAATEGIGFYFRLDKIKDDKIALIRVIYHEIAHCLLFARNKYSQLDCSEKEGVRRRCEEETSWYERYWLRNLRANRELCDKLMADNLIRQYADEFHFAEFLT